MAGKKAKEIARLKRLNKKRARKATNQAKYEAFIKAGQNRKSKRAGKSSGKKEVRAVKHAVSNCGNLGCSKCFDFSNPWKVKPASCIFSKRWSSSKWKSGAV